MKIPQQLPQFEDQQVLLIVVGSQSGILYSAADGEIDSIQTIQQPTPRYTDREGFFASMRKGFGRSGSVYEDDKVQQTRKFFKKVANEVHVLLQKQTITQIYIFEPPHTKGYLTTALRELSSVKVDLVKYGNYIHTPPLSLIEFIQQLLDRSIDPAEPDSVNDNEKNTSERRRLLAIAKQARQFIGGKH